MERWVPVFTASAHRPIVVVNTARDLKGTKRHGTGTAREI